MPSSRRQQCRDKDDRCPAVRCGPPLDDSIAERKLTRIDRSHCKEEMMAFNVSGWGTVRAGQTLPFGYIFGNGDDHGAQFAMGKPEGALQDGSSTGALVSFNAEIDLDVASQAISYNIQIQ